jgi:DNA-binding response OmpR family regulator
MSKRVLLCDDEIHILRAAEFKLARAGYEVECALDGVEGWEAIQRQLPDIVVTDLQMPRMNGLELARQIRDNAATRELPVLLLTAKGYEVQHTGVATELGIVRVLTKPFSPRELLAVVTETLEKSAAPVNGQPA